MCSILCAKTTRLSGVKYGQEIRMRFFFFCIDGELKLKKPQNATFKT